MLRFSLILKRGLCQRDFGSKQIQCGHRPALRMSPFRYSFERERQPFVRLLDRCHTGCTSTTDKILARFGARRRSTKEKAERALKLVRHLRVVCQRPCSTRGAALHQDPTRREKSELTSCGRCDLHSRLPSRSHFPLRRAFPDAASAKRWKCPSVIPLDSNLHPRLGGF